VDVRPHASYGSIATITIAHVADNMREPIAEEVHALLAPFVLRHEIIFA
jgi:fatty-acyl-CoA synthase